MRHGLRNVLGGLLAPVNTLQIGLHAGAFLFVGSCMTSDQRELRHDHLMPIPVATSVLNASPVIGRPGAIELSGSYLWISDLSADPGLHVLNARTGTLVRSIGRRGEGPGEFSTRPFVLARAPSDTVGIWAWDLQLQRLTYFTGHDSTRSLRQIQLSGPVRIHRIAWITDDLLAGQASSDTLRFTLFDSAGAITAFRPGAAIGGADMPARLRLNVTNNATRMCQWPGRGFAIVNSLVGRVEIHDTDARLTRLADVPFPSDPRVVNDPSLGLIIDAPRRWYMDCTATREHLFALFSGRSASAYDGDRLVSGRFVHVFDSAGALVRVLQLDRDVHAMAVDPSGRSLYAVSLSDGVILVASVPQGQNHE